MESSGPGQGQAVEFCEQGSVASGFIHCGTFHSELKNCSALSSQKGFCFKETVV